MSRTRTPRAAATSALTELSSSGRYKMATMARAGTPKAATSGIALVPIVNMEPNRIVTVAPVVEVDVVSQYRNNAARPRPAPRTIPVARSRPRGLRMPIMSITPAAITPVPAKPHSGLMLARKDADPPVTDRSASAWPEYDCPRSTVKVPTTPDTSAAIPPTASATCTGELAKKPGANSTRSTEVNPVSSWYSMLYLGRGVIRVAWRSRGLVSRQDFEPVTGVRDY